MQLIQDTIDKVMVRLESVEMGNGKHESESSDTNEEYDQYQDVRIFNKHKKILDENQIEFKIFSYFLN